MATNDAVRIEHDSMGEVRVPADARWGAQTQRAVENFPISGATIDRELIGALASIKGAAATVNGRLKVIPKDIATAIHDAAAEVADRPVGRPLPDRRVPDRLGHVVEHEHERGDRDAGVGAAGRGRSTRTTTSTRPSPRTTCSRRPSTSPWSAASSRHLVPALEHLGATLREGGAAVPDRREVGPDPPHGRHAGDPRPGVRRLRRADRRGHRAPPRHAAAGRPSCRSAAPRWAPASTPRRRSPAT